MSTLTVCDWCHQPLDPGEFPATVASIGGPRWLSREFHEGCFNEWFAMVEMAEQHRGVVEAVT